MPATDAELIDRARALAPAIKARATEVAEMRKVHDDTIKELLDAEILQMWGPKKWGGSEAKFSTIFDVVRPISAACPSTGWITAFYILHNMYIAKFPEQAQEEAIGTNGYALLPAASAPDLKAEKVDGGWKVSGRAIWGSGIMHADWVMMSGNTDIGPRSFLMPVSDVEILDVWHYTGMSGTGSNDYVAKDVFVPDHRSVSLLEFFAGETEGSRIHENPFYGMPFFILALSSIMPVISGALAGAMEEYEGIMEKRVRSHTATVIKDQQHAHITLGGFELALEMAEDLARTGYAQAEAILGNRAFTIEDRVAAKGRVAFVSNLCRDTMNKMMIVAGSSSFHDDKRIQRHWKDINMVCSHAFWDWDVTREMIGRQQLGLDLNTPLV